MLNFERYYLGPISHWINDPANSAVFTKFPGLCSKPALNNLLADTAEMTAAHQEFCRVLKERYNTIRKKQIRNKVTQYVCRLDMWGPTQFISDIFANFVSCPLFNLKNQIILLAPLV